MIYDRIENIGQYKGISKSMDKAIEWVQAHDLSKVGLDKVTIDDDVRYFGQIYVGKKEEEANYEVHHRYADIQIVVKGKEKMTANPKNVEMHPIAEFSEEKDVQKLYNDVPAASECICSDMEFAIFFPYEFHRPCVGVDDKEIQKVVVKVRMA